MACIQCADQIQIHQLNMRETQGEMHLLSNETIRIYSVSDQVEELNEEMKYLFPPIDFGK